MTIIKLGKEISIDLEKLLKTRMLIQANAGGGKSYLIRKLLEETHGKVQQIVLDLEGEFSTLREKYDYLLVGTEGDIPIEVRSAELLAKKLLETHVSAILDLYELKKHERILFVKIFLDSMINAKKELWHPVLVIIDEAHVLCPEGKSGSAESTGSVIDLMSRGRKRGFCGVLATQRIAKLHKDSTAECNNKLIGRTSQDIDMKRAGDELGFTSKEQIRSLRNLKEGEFFAFGTAISHEIIKGKIGKVKTTHPESGTGKLPAPPKATDKIKQILKKLIDLPQKAEEELKEKQDYLKKINELKSENRKLKVGLPNSEEIERIKKISFQQGFKKSNVEFNQIYSGTKKTIKNLELRIINASNILGKEFKSLPELPKTSILNDESLHYPDMFKSREKPLMHKSTQEYLEVPERKIKLKSGAIRMLNTIAMFKTISRNRTKTIAGISSQGTFSTYVQDLKRSNYIETNGKNLSITNEGLEFNGEPQPFPTDTESLINLWSKHLKSGTIRMLKICVGVYPNSISRAELKEESGISSQGTFSTYTQDLKRNQLIKIDGSEITASTELFE